MREDPGSQKKDRYKIAQKADFHSVPSQYSKFTYNCGMTSNCICGKLREFTQVITYRNETVFKEYEGSVIAK